MTQRLISKTEGINGAIKDTFLKFFEHLFLFAITIMAGWSYILTIIVGILIFIDVLKIKGVTTSVLQYRSMFGDSEERDK